MNSQLNVWRNEILSLHSELIEAHLHSRIDFFIRDLAPDYFSVNNGEIKFKTKEEIYAQFSDYLPNTKFEKYANLIDPIVEISKDGSMAWILVKMKIIGKKTLHDGNIRDLDFTCAWVTLYRRDDEKWLRVGEVSSF